MIGKPKIDILFRKADFFYQMIKAIIENTIKRLGIALYAYFMHSPT